MSTIAMFVVMMFMPVFMMMFVVMMLIFMIMLMRVEVVYHVYYIKYVLVSGECFCFACYAVKAVVCVCKKFVVGVDAGEHYEKFLLYPLLLGSVE